MKLNASSLEINFSEVEKVIECFIKGYIKSSGVDGIVIGLSGGVDSCTVAALASQAIGGDKIIGLILPEEETCNNTDINDAKIVADKFNIKVEKQDLSKVLSSFYNNLSIFDHRDKVSKGNIKARTRMIYLYYYANKFNRIVCGTSDKSETMIGYFTKWGDGAADISPIRELYKTQVQKLALYLGIPKKIALKPPSPSLWLNQSAESELGIKYEILDLILYGLEQLMTIEEIVNNLNIKKSIILKIRDRWLSTEHKRQLPLTTKIGFRNIGSNQEANKRSG